MKKYLPLLILLLLVNIAVSAQQKSGAEQFWNNLKQHCGKAYQGEITQGLTDDFKNKSLMMHVRSCEDGLIKIPFFVGEDKSRTWVLKLKNDRILLKHDHRHKDGTPDQITQYGGLATNSGQESIQIFPADQETLDLLPAAAGNVWWITLTKDSFTYNLRRIGSDRLFTVKFDLTKPIATPSAPWGTKD
ncbi:hypothetical protein [Pedobacter sp. Hv1]|uniref:hypothetical protein n=1 Tax=Pedobacter sp. Hv1 TaxID=1740090 RepID=UPI0006D8BF3F|nr:hypothetical protein [Pedobacter sp. Hv1]KQC02676.1 hypothetical protein AQF98_03625 [Pedobacter sp. Hv1]